MARKSSKQTLPETLSVHPIQDKLIAAAAVGDVVTCRFLIEDGADCRFPGSSGETPAEVAARGGHLECLEEFLNTGLAEAWHYAGLDDDDDEDDAEAPAPWHDGGEALRAAAVAGQTKVALMLIFEGVNVDSVDEQGRTALHLAALHDSHDIVSALIDAEADIHKIDHQKRTPLHFARMGRSAVSARHLLNAGANPKAEAKGQKKTPAALAGQSERIAETGKSRFIYYLGAKNNLLDMIVQTIPWIATRLIEPFVGSGAVTGGLAFRFEHIDASDANPDIVAALKLAVDDPEALIAELDEIFGPALPKKTEVTELLIDAERKYYNQRLKEFTNRSKRISPVRRVALYVYLNRMGFKGLQRITKREKKFSVPFWKDRIGQSNPDEQIREFHERLDGKVTFRVRDFKEAFVGAGVEDFIYLDPPYLPSEGKQETHTGYAGTEFGESHHAELARLAREAADEGATVVVSNHDSALIRKLYASADEIRSLTVLRGMAHGGDEQEEVDEILAIWKPSFSWVIEASERPLDPVDALDPFDRNAHPETIDRIVWRTAKRNGWLEAKADPKHLTFESFKKSGAQLLTIARHGAPAAQRLVFGRPGREKLLGLEFLAELVMLQSKKGVPATTVNDFFVALLSLVEGIEAFVVDPKLRDAIVKRAFKTKLKVLLNPDGDAKRTLIRDRLPKRYGFAAAVMQAKRWSAGSEPGGRLLLLAERCVPSATDAFDLVCKGILRNGVTENAFVAMFPSVKTGPARGVGVDGHGDLKGKDFKAAKTAWPIK
jgi:DNA adenine methylase